MLLIYYIVDASFSAHLTGPVFFFNRFDPRLFLFFVLEKSRSCLVRSRRISNLIAAFNCST